MPLASQQKKKRSAVADHKMGPKSVTFTHIPLIKKLIWMMGFGYPPTG